MATEPVAALRAHSPSRETMRPAAYTRGWSDGWFYFGCAWLIVAVVAYGFAHTISENLLRAAIPRPGILWIHATVFFGWIGLFTLQSSLVRFRRVRWHRSFGRGILLLGATMPLIGIATSLVMARFNVAHGSDPVDTAAFLSIPFNDMTFFSGVLAAAAWWRKRPDAHRRLMLIATCLLTAAAFPRFPFITINSLRWYAGVDLLLLLGVAHDLIVHRRVHAAYAICLPPVLIGQTVAMWLFLARPEWWVNFAERLMN
jgi:hypothetical protein